MSIVSGPQLHIRAVVQGLARRKHQVRTLIPRNGQPLWSDDLANPEWHAARYGFSRSKWFRAVERPVRRAQSQFRFPYINFFESLRFADAVCDALAASDLILERYSFLGYGGAFAAARLNIPLVLEINGDVAKELDVLGVQMSPLQRKASAQVTRRTLVAATGIVCVAPQIKQRLCDTLHLPPDKIAVIPNGADVELFAHAHDAAAVREKYQLEVRPTIIFVGSFQPWHGVDLLLDSFFQVTRALPNAQLLMVGDGLGRAAAVEQVRTAGMNERVHFLGQRNNLEVSELLAVSDVAVAPFPYRKSDIVGSPLKLFEYMAAGRAIVATTAPLHDVIEHNVTGLRVAPADSNALCNAIVDLLESPRLRERLGSKARQVALERYSWNCTIQQLETFLLHTREKFRVLRHT